MTRTNRCGLVAALVLATALSGCDAFDDAPPIEHQGPLVSEFQITPAEVSVDTLATTEEGFVVPVQLSLRATAGDAPIDRVRYSIEWQFACSAGTLEANGEFEAAGDGLFTVSPDLTLRPGRRGAFRVTTWAVDQLSRPSNEASATLFVGGTNLGPPVITTVDAPTQVQPPATVRMQIDVDDPDGVDHIARAEVSFPGGGTLPMSDTDSSGNPTPCNGRYSVAFSVPAGVEAGSVTFTFTAFDRDGAASEPVQHTVEILG